MLVLFSLMVCVGMGIYVMRIPKKTKSLSAPELIMINAIAVEHQWQYER
jgi:hypothetical protein